jgi:tyrosyl-tRNA synthetase
MLERDYFHKRFVAGEPISIHEFLYPLSQAYDSVALRADVELGGTDQKFNLMVGRDIQHEVGQPSQIVLTTPLLEGLNGGQKMSKSLGNYVGITEAPENMFGKLMSVSDELMWRYMLLLTDRSEAEIEGMRRRVAEEGQNPMAVKKALAHDIVAEFHGAPAADRARVAFEHVAQQRQPPEQVETSHYPLPAASGDRMLRVDRMLADLGLAPSVSEALRLIKSGAVSFDGERVAGPAYTLASERCEILVKVGKRRFARVRFDGMPRDGGG